MRVRPALLSLLLALPLGAQVLEPSMLGLQGRISIPEGSFRDALGGLRVPGFGASLFAEMDLGDSLHYRLGLGADLWPQGKGNLGSDDRQIQALHADGELLYLLRDDGEKVTLGPYLLAGLSGYSWSLGKDVTGSGQTRRVTHAAATLGFGYRLMRHLDAEVKVLAGTIDPGVKALALAGGFNYRF
jgi:hypothetical protein